MKMKKTRLLSLALVLAMVLALVPTVFALEKGEISSVTLSASTLTMGGATATASATCSKAAAGEGHEDGHIVTYSVASGDAVTVDPSTGEITAAHAGKATVKATCKCGAFKVSDEITVNKGAVTPPTNTIALNVEAEISETEVKSRLSASYDADSYVYADKAKVERGDWTLNSGETFAATAGTVLHYTAPLTAAADYEFAEGVTASVSATVTVVAGPQFDVVKKVGTTTVTVDDLYFVENTAAQTLSVTATLASDSTSTGAELTYKWYRNGTAVAQNGEGASYTVPADDLKTKDTTVTYTCEITATKNGAKTVKTAKFVVHVMPKFRVTVTRTDSYSKPTVGMTLSYLAKVEVYNATTSTVTEAKYRDAVAVTDYDSVVFTANSGGNAVANNSVIKTTLTTTVGLYGVSTSSPDSSTVYVTATVKKGSGAETGVGTSSAATFYPVETSDVQITPSGSIAYMDESSLLYAVQRAYSSSAKPYKMMFSSSCGSFNYSTAYTSYYTSSAYSNKVSNTTFTPNTYYANFVNNPTATFYATDSNGAYVVAKGTIRFTSTGSITYSTTTNVPVSFDGSDFQAFYQKMTNKYATLESITITGAPTVVGSATVGTLYYNSYSYSGYSTSSYYNSYFKDIPVSSIKNLSYSPSASTSKYYVNIPFTASGYTTSIYSSSKTQVSGIVTVNVNDGHIIGMTGTDFKTAGIWSDILSKHPNTSYVVFSQPQSTVGKLYYGYSSIANKGSLVSYTNRFSNISYNYSYASTNKSIDGIYFVPAADCLTTVSIPYTAYTSSGSVIGTSDTITFTVSKKTSSYWFNDVTASNTGKWSADAIDFLAANSIVEGGSYGTFNPNGNMTRGDFVLMLYRLAGKPSVSGISNPFTDVKATDYYYNAILWAYRNDIVTGIDRKTFAPKKNITREQIAATLYRMAGSPSTSGSISGYYDASKVHSYATNAMRWAVAGGVVTGSNGYLTPTNNATRAQVATMLHRYLTK